MLSIRSFVFTAGILLLLPFSSLSASEKRGSIPDRATVSLTNLEPVKLAKDQKCHLLVAKCRLNGIPCSLIVDTAASHTTFDVKFIRRHFPDLPLQETPIAPGSNVNAIPHWFPMDSFTIGGLLIKDFYGLAMDLTPLQKNSSIRIDGILGMNYMGFCPFRLSVRDASIQFLERSKLPVQHMKMLDTERHPSGVFYVRCSRGGDSFLLALDSGSTLSLAPIEQWPANPGGDHLTALASDINGSSKQQIAMKLGVPSTLRMGPEFQMENLSFVVTGTGGKRQIGVDTLQYFDIIIDAPQEEVFALPFHSMPESRKNTSPEASATRKS